MHCRGLIGLGLLLYCCGAAARPDVPSTINGDEAMRLAAEAYHWPETCIWFDRRKRSFFIVAPLSGGAGGPVR